MRSVLRAFVARMILSFPLPVASLPWDKGHAGPLPRGWDAICLPSMEHHSKRTPPSPTKLTHKRLFFQKDHDSARASLAPRASMVRRNHKPTPLGGMVQAALYLEESTQRCYTLAWAYDYMVLMQTALRELKSTGCKSWHTPQLLCPASVSLFLKVAVELLFIR